MTKKNRALVQLASSAEPVQREGNEMIWKVTLRSETAARTVRVHAMAGLASAVQAALQQAHNEKAAYLADRKIGSTQP